MSFPTNPIDGQIYKKYKYSTALNAWQTYDVTDFTSIMQEIDLSTANQEVVLPALTGGQQEISYKWVNGGTYKVQFKMPDNSYSEYEGESEGYIKFSATSNAWVVTAYEDSGNNSNGDWVKYLNKKLKCRCLDKQWPTQAVSTGASIHWDLPHSFSDTSKVSALCTPRYENGTGSQSTVGYLTYNGIYWRCTDPTYISFSSYSYHNAINNPVYVEIEAEGTWADHRADIHCQSEKMEEP